MTTKDEIREWLKRGQEQGASHVIIVCDTFDHEDYPVFIMPGEDPRKKDLGEMQRPMECYSMGLPIEEQITELRANHWEVYER